MGERMDDVPSDELLAYLRQFLSEPRYAHLEHVLQWRTRHLVVVLEDLANAHNTSACLRSCDGCGVQEVHVIENRTNFEVSPQIAVGAGQWLDLVTHGGEPHNTRRCLQDLRGRGYRIVATSPSPEATPLPEYDIRPKTALLFGNERDGLSEAALEEADELVAVPMFGFSGSFNVSVTVAICVYELTQALRRSGVAWRLDEADRGALRARWIRRAVGTRRLPYLEARFREEQSRGANRPQSGYAAERSKMKQWLRPVVLALPSLVVGLVAGWATCVVLTASFSVLAQWVVPKSVPRPPGAILYMVAIALNGLFDIAVGAFFGTRCWRKLSALFEHVDTMRARRESMPREG